MSSENATWLKVLGIEELPEGRVKPVTCQHRTLCLTHFDGQYADFAHPNLGWEPWLLHCPHTRCLRTPSPRAAFFSDESWRLAAS